MISGSSEITVREYQSAAELTEIFAEFLKGE
jgi:hypothetical protein